MCLNNRMNDNNLKRLQSKLIKAYFMKAPHPMAITRTENGTYIELNEASTKYMGFSRKKLIGCKSTEVGHMPLAKRRMIIEEIKAKGYAKNIELESRPQKNEVQYLLFNVFPMKLGKESFFLSVVTDISKSKHKEDVLFRLRITDTERVKEKLKQYKFSPRQKEVAFLASCGYSNSEIASKLYISEYTVKDHLKIIYKVIGVHHRAEISPKILKWR
jgi:PAS domain S-box-containing protein